MSKLAVANIIFETTEANRIEYTGNNVVRVRANGGLQIPYGTTAQRVSPEYGIIRYNTDLGTVEMYDAGGWYNMPTGGYVNSIYTVANSAYAAANNVGPQIAPTFNTANAAYNQANLGYTSSNVVYAAVNSAFATINADYAFTNSAYASINSNWTVTNTVYGVANAAYGAANNVGPQIAPAYNTANAAYGAANTKFSSSGGTISGAVEITADLTVRGNTRFIDQQTLLVGDPLIYLAANNYTSDVVDIGFVANYVNTTSSNVHTGLFRSSGTKEYYLFQGYDKEPLGNYIDPTGNNITMAVLNSTVRTSNLILSGANAVNWISSNYNTANAAYGVANSAFAKANNALANTADVTFAGRFNIPERLLVSQTTSGTNGILVNMPTGAETTASGLRVMGYSPAIELMDKDSVQNWYMGIDDNDGNKLIFGRGYGPGQGVTQAITVDTSDNVGIGTTSPVSRLHVNGISYFDATYNRLRNPTYNRYRSDYSVSTGGVAGFNSYDDTGNVYMPFEFGSSTFRILTGNSGSTEAFYADASGRVGIGTTSPTQKLHVVGTGYATSDFRAPIFYDGDNTGYYINPNGSSNIYDLYIQSGLYLTNGRIYNNTKLNWYSVDGTATSGQNRISTAIYRTGLCLYPDINFSSGVNGIGVYDNNSSGQTTITRISAPAGTPSNSGYVLQVQHTGSGQTPGYGGIYFGTLSRANATLTIVFKAKLPSGYTLNFASNPYGSGGTDYWVTDNVGTGKWEDYVCVVRCGDSSPFGTTHFYYVTGSPTPSAGSPLTWYISSATVYDHDSSNISGSILQVQQTAKTSTTSIAVSANQWNEFDSAFRVTITPKTTSSRIILSAYITGAQNTGTVRYKFQFSTNGGSSWSDVTPIGDAVSNRSRGHFGYAVNGDTNQFNTCSMELVHSPATTSAVIYRIQFGQDVTTTYHFNRSIAYTDNFLGGTMTSTIIAKEIAV